MSDTSYSNYESFKLPDLLDLHKFSKASTVASDEPNSGTPIITQIISGINEELRSSVMKHQKIHEIDKQSNQSMLMELKKVRNDYLKEKEEWKQREKSLLDEQEVLEKTISTLKYELLRSKTELSALTSENLRLSSLNCLKEFNFLTTDDFKGNPNNLSYSSIELESLRKNSSNSTLDSSDLLKQKDQIINNLKLELSEAKILNKSILLNRQMSRNNELEEILAQKLRVFKIPGTFIRDPEQNYIHNGKKITLIIKSGQLLCKSGTMFRPFEEFVKSLGGSNRTGHLSTSHKRFKSQDFQSSDPRTPTSSSSRSKVKF